MKKYLFMAVAAIAALSGCSSDEEFANEANGNKKLVFTATMEGSEATRATFDGTKMYAEWEKGDQISINGKIYSALAAGTATTFKADGEDATGTTYNAYFPADLYDGTTATLPANINETWADGKFNMPMYAYSTTTELAFKNICGVLKITVKNNQMESVKSIKVSSSNCATSGAFTVNTDNSADLTTPDVPANTVTVTYTVSVTTDATGKVFYVAIPPQTYKNLSIAVSDGTTTKVMTTKKDQDITVARNTVYPISFGGTLTTTGTATRAEGEGTTDVKWIQLWEDGPKFAEYNVGATSATEYGGYYTWGGSTDMSSSDFNTGSDPLSGNNDTATKLWGSNWRMPTQTELEKLLVAANCTVEWIDGSNKKYNNTNVAGLLCTGKGAYASNSVFLPAAGYCDDGSVRDQGGSGCYWSSTPDATSPYAFSLNFYSGDQCASRGFRNDGYSVRAVLAETSLPDGALSGVFSVSGNKQVYFSQGNLWYGKVGSATTATFNFEANQYDTTPASDEYWSSDHISHFYWSKTASVAYAEVYNDGSTSDSDVFFTNADETTSKDDFTVNVGGTQQTGWRTLSKDEWTYLFNTRTVNSGTGEGKSYQRATINSDATSVYGMILFPDNYTGTAKTSYTSAEWVSLETAGCVFLPAAGSRDGSSVTDVGNGYYWSSTGISTSYAYYVFFDKDGVIPDIDGVIPVNDYAARNYGSSVRLITESK